MKLVECISTSYLHYNTKILNLMILKHRLHRADTISSCDVAVVQWILSCHKNHMTTRVITLWPVYVTALTMSASAMSFLTEIMLILKAIKSHF